MRIGIDARLWNETGVGRYIRSLFFQLQQLDQRNEYVWFFREKEFESVTMPNQKWRKVLANVRWHTIAEQVVLPWIFYRERLDLLHFPYFSFPILYPGKFVVTIHDLIFDHYKTGRASTLPHWFYYIKKIGYHCVQWVITRRAKKIFTLSEDAKSEIVSHYNTPKEKIIVTYEAGTMEDSGLDQAKMHMASRALRPYILYVGNAHPHKNVEGLILAMKEVFFVYRDLKLVLIGHDPFFYPQIEKLIFKQQANKNVILAGSLSNAELALWYRNALAFITASKMEGFGIPPLEAMSMGCPILVSDIPVFHEIYGDAAMYFNHVRPHAIANTILQFVNNESLRKKCIKRGYERIKRYSWKKMAEETLTIYESCSSARSE